MEKLYIKYLENYLQSNKSKGGNFLGIDVEKHKRILETLSESGYIKGLKKNITNPREGAFHYITSEVSTTKAGELFLEELLK